MNFVSKQCSDKTGTLTQNKMTVKKLCTGGQIIPADGADFSRPEQRELLRAALLCSDATVTLVIAVRIALMPVIAGISYEITVKWAGSHPENPLVKVILWPGMQMQKLTTREPDDGQIECAIAAMRKVLEREDAEAAKETNALAG